MAVPSSSIRVTGTALGAGVAPTLVVADAGSTGVAAELPGAGPDATEQPANRHPRSAARTPVRRPLLATGRLGDPARRSGSKGRRVECIVPTLSLEGSSNLRLGRRPDFRRASASVTVAGLCRTSTGFATQAGDLMLLAERITPRRASGLATPGRARGAPRRTSSHVARPAPSSRVKRNPDPQLAQRPQPTATIPASCCFPWPPE
jgi:hypothetical protein